MSLNFAIWDALAKIKPSTHFWIRIYLNVDMAFKIAFSPAIQYHMVGKFGEFTVMNA